MKRIEPDRDDRDDYATISTVARYFALTKRTLDRWLHNPEIAFPPPDLVVAGHRYWRKTTYENWRPAASQVEVEPTAPTTSRAPARRASDRSSARARR